MEDNTLWMRLPDGEPVEVPAEPQAILDKLNAGYRQCPAPEVTGE